ncbi:MAG: hypothetical protein ABJK25_00275 [Halieaceae bacterium]
MTTIRASFSGPIIVYLTLVACALALYAALDGSDIIESSRAYLRLSGRVGMGLFFVSFGASALHHLFNTGWSNYLVKNRRYYGISTAIVLWSHFLVILSLSVTASEWFRDSAPWFILYPGAGVFLVVGLMALTSNNFAVKKMGAQRWRTLHLVGGYAALSAFAYEYVLVLYLQPIILPDYQFVTANSVVMAHLLLAVPLLLLYLRFKKG